MSGEETAGFTDCSISKINELSEENLSNHKTVSEIKTEIENEINSR